MCGGDGVVVVVEDGNEAGGNVEMDDDLTLTDSFTN